MIVFEDRLSDSPLVERVWRSHSQRAGAFLSIAASTFEMVVSRHGGRTFLTLRGPETHATVADLPADGEWLGIRFKVGAFVSYLTPGNLADRRDVTLPAATGRSFWLNGSAWDYPDFENVETFVARLVRGGILARDPVVGDALRRGTTKTSLRTLQRRVVRATGLTSGAIRQIERARYATTLLRAGVSIADVAHLAGYYDQAHLTRSLRHRIGQTPGEIIRRGEQLSFLYKTAPPWSVRCDDMTPSTPSHDEGRISRPAVRIGYALTGLAAMFLAFDTVMKLLVLDPAVQATTELGYPAATVFWIGLIELVCLVLYLVPRTSVLGAILLVGYLGGAVATHVRVGNPLASHTLFPVYVAAVLWGGLYLREPRLRHLLPLRR